MIPSESDNRKASRCLPTSKTVVAKIGLIAVESTGTEDGVIIGVVKSYSKSFRDKRIRGTWFQLESKEDLNLPCLSSFIDHAKAQWDIVKSNSDYYYHRPKFTDLEEYKQLTDEAVDLGKRTYLSPHEQFRLYNLNKRKDQLFATGWNRKNQITVINRFVYYLFFGKHRKTNRWD